jgi:hypothetical protein
MIESRFCFIRFDLWLEASRDPFGGQPLLRETFTREDPLLREAYMSFRACEVTLSVSSTTSTT